MFTINAEYNLPFEYAIGRNYLFTRSVYVLHVSFTKMLFTSFIG